MNDCISRQAVLKQMNCWIGSGEYRYTNATDYLTKRIAELPSVHSVCTDGDCISRKQALYEFEQDQYHDDFCREHNIDHSISMEMVRIRLHDLPTVSCSEKANRSGEWIPDPPFMAKCSLCGYIQPTNGADMTGKALVHKAIYKYCPNCGAKMGV